MNRFTGEMTHIITLLSSICFVCIVGCSNECERLAERICDQAGEDKLTCETSPNSLNKDEDEANKKRCKRIQTVAASCSYLQEQARHPTDEDLLACKQNLEFIRSLERQMQ